jgi:hypothetical protein
MAASLSRGKMPVKTPLEHPEIQRLLQFGVTKEQIEQFRVLCLPENLLAAADTQDLLDSQDAVDLAKRLREAGVRCANSLDLTPEAGSIQRRGLDLWLGTVWILDRRVNGVFAKVLIRKLKGWMQRTNGKKARVHLRLRICRGGDAAEIGYHGDGRTLIRFLEGLGRGNEKAK